MFLHKEVKEQAKIFQIVFVLLCEQTGMTNALKINFLEEPQIKNFQGDRIDIHY